MEISERSLEVLSAREGETPLPASGLTRMSHGLFPKADLALILSEADIGSDLQERSREIKRETLCLAVIEFNTAVPVTSFKT